VAKRRNPLSGEMKLEIPRIRGGEIGNSPEWKNKFLKSIR